MINYKEIDDSTDMIIATNSNIDITYIRIISSSAHPSYTVDISKSQKFTDPISSTTRKLSAIFIID
jgi:hypothetical protein